MSANVPVSPNDLGKAGRGNLPALRRLRDHWIALADASASIALLPKDEVLSQAELLAELAAGGSGLVEDSVALLIIYQIRMEGLKRHKASCEDLARVAVDQDNIADLDGWTRSQVEFSERLEHYRAKVAALLAQLLVADDANGTAMLVSALSTQADAGDERALPLMQNIIDSVTPDRAQAIQSEVRKLHAGALQ